MIISSVAVISNSHTTDYHSLITFLEFEQSYFAMADPYGDPYSTPYLPPPSYPTNNNGSSMNKETGGYYGGEAPRNGPGPDRFAPRQGGHREGGGRGGRDQDRGRRRQNGPPEDNRNNGRHGHPYGTSGRHSGGGDGGWRPRGGSNGGADVGWGKRASQAGKLFFSFPYNHLVLRGYLLPFDKKDGTRQIKLNSPDLR